MQNNNKYLNVANEQKFEIARGAHQQLFAISGLAMTTAVRPISGSVIRSARGKTTMNGGKTICMPTIAPPEKPETLPDTIVIPDTLPPLSDPVWDPVRTPIKTPKEPETEPVGPPNKPPDGPKKPTK